MKHVEKPILIPIGHETARTSVKTPIDKKKVKSSYRENIFHCKLCWILIVRCPRKPSWQCSVGSRASSYVG